jgi:hypothetical protein
LLDLSHLYISQSIIDTTRFMAVPSDINRPSNMRSPGNGPLASNRSLFGGTNGFCPLTKSTAISDLHGAPIGTRDSRCTSSEKWDKRRIFLRKSCQICEPATLISEPAPSCLKEAIRHFPDDFDEARPCTIHNIPGYAAAPTIKKNRLSRGEALHAQSQQKLVLGRIYLSFFLF